MDRDIDTDSDSTVIVGMEPSAPARPAWSQVRLYREAHLTDPVKCASWCISVGLLSGGGECARHLRPRQLVPKKGKNHPAWRCSACKADTSCLDGSVFEGSRLTLGCALMLAHCYAHGLTYDATRLACSFEGEPGPADTTIARWFGFFRDLVAAAVPECPRERGKIGGPGKVVQIDEALIGRRKYNRGRAMPGTWVLGMIDSDGLVRMEVCPKRDASTLERLVRKWVRAGSTIHTDEWRGYRGLSRLGYNHATVNHSKEFVAGSGAHTQRIESQWRAMRRRFSPGGIRHKDIPEKLFEYVWRRKCRKSNQDPFFALLEMLKIEK